MNGTKNDNEKLLDSSFCINFLNKRIEQLPEGILLISRVSRFEILSKPAYKFDKEDEQAAKDFIAILGVLSVSPKVEYLTIQIRRNNHRIKLPDAIIAATALDMDIPLLSCDAALVSQLKVAAPELYAEYVKPLDSPV